MEFGEVLVLYYLDDLIIFFSSCLRIAQTLLKLAGALHLIILTDRNLARQQQLHGARLRCFTSVLLLFSAPTVHLLWLHLHFQWTLSRCPLLVYFVKILNGGVVG